MLRPGRLIPQSFYLRPVETVAVDLLGQCLVQDEVVLRITEVEAYGGPEDSASHCRFGRTLRNAPMWEAGGLSYLYLCYGIHWMLNVVTGPADSGAAVLIRACEVLQGQALVQDRRGRTGLLDGPGKVGQALGLDARLNALPLYRRGALELREGASPSEILTGARVGVDFASPEDREAPWRFAAGGSASVSHRKKLSASKP